MDWRTVVLRELLALLQIARRAAEASMLAGKMEQHAYVVVTVAPDGTARSDPHVVTRRYRVLATVAPNGVVEWSV